MSNNWASAELIEHQSEELERLQSMGMGRRRIAKYIEELTGRGCNPGTVGIALSKIGLHSPRKMATRIDIKEEPLESCEMPIDELIESRIQASQRKIKSTAKHKKTIELPAEPVGVVVFGDVHIDNDGCDFKSLMSHVRLIQETEGILAVQIGDMQDNWIGRLQRNFADASITASDGWRLSEWLLGSGENDAGLQWLALIGGNHDSWANAPGLDPLSWLSKRCGIIAYAPDEIRLTLTWKGHPDLDPIVWILRHHFSGQSWFHPTHGPHKEAMLDGECHVTVAGHIHQWGELTTEQRHGRINTALRVRGYKRADSYAKMKGFYEQDHGESCLVVLDPFADGPGRVTTFWDLKRGCEFLTMLRGRQ